MIFSLAQQNVWYCLIAGLLLLGLFDCRDIFYCFVYNQSLANVTMAIIAYCRAKRPQGIDVGECTKEACNIRRKLNYLY
jgi:hypothetical protein